MTEPNLVRKRCIEIVRQFPYSSMQTRAPRRSSILRPNTLQSPPEPSGEESKLSLNSAHESLPWIVALPVDLKSGV